MSREQEVPMCMCNDAWHRSNFDNHKHDCDVAVLVVQLRAQLAAAEETIRQAFDLNGGDNGLNASWTYAAMYEKERTRAERAEAEIAYLRRAFRGAVESDALAITYQTIGSYRAGLLKTLNALDTTRDGQGA